MSYFDGALPPCFDRVLILGGCGFFGRWVVTRMVEKNFAPDITVLDMSLPEASALSKRHVSAFKRVHFQQCNYRDPETIANAFKRDDGKSFDAVVNLGCEQRYGRSKEEYKRSIYDSAVYCAALCSQSNVKVLVHVSSARVYTSEDGNPDGVSESCIQYLLADKEIASIEGLNAVILRPTLVYGPGDLGAISQALVIGRIYRNIGKTLFFPHTPSIVQNTLHVYDLARAICHVADWYSQEGKQGVLTFDISDVGNTDTDVIYNAIALLFNSKKHEKAEKRCLSKSHLKSENSLRKFIEDQNSFLINGWAELLKRGGIRSSYLTPYIDHKAINLAGIEAKGESFMQYTGFQLAVPELSTEALQDIIREYQELECWPLPDEVLSEEGKVSAKPTSKTSWTVRLRSPLS